MIRRRKNARRSGAVLVETAFVLPVLAILLAGMTEFGHAYLILFTLKSAARQAARDGAVEGTTTAEVQAKVNAILSSSITPAEALVYVKDASVFDEGDVEPGTIDYSGLPDINLEDAQPQQLYLVRIEVPYADVAIMPPFWTQGVVLTGQAVMRHE